MRIGGWIFLQDEMAPEPEEEEGSDDGDEGEAFRPARDDYVPDEDEWEEEDDDGDYGEEDDEDDFEEEEDEEDPFEEEEEEEEGLDWDELERRAAESDRKKNMKRKFDDDGYGG